MYNLIFNYLKDYIFSNQYLEDTTFTMFNGTISLQDWLCHTTCIVLAVIFFIVILLLFRYMFRLFGGLLSLR